MSILPTIELEVLNEIRNPDNNADVEEWKPETSLIVGDSMIADVGEVKLSRNKKVKVCFFPGAKDKRFLLLFSSFAEERTK